MFNKFWTALVTPFDGTLDIDFDSLKRLLAWHRSSNNGVLLFGSTGEGLSLSIEEKRKILEVVFNSGSVKNVMVNLSAFNLVDLEKHLEVFEKYPIAAYLSAPPPYYKLGPQAVEGWFNAVRERTERDLVLYNIPGRTSCEIPPILLKKFKPAGLKESSGDLNKFLEYCSFSDRIFCGDDDMWLVHQKIGAYGIISVMSNLWCHMDSIEPILWHKIAGEMKKGGVNPLPIKYLLAKNGIIDYSVVRFPLNDMDLSNLEGLQNCLKFVVVS